MRCASGTELKVFRGDFDDGAQLDTSIASMAEDKMSYPLAYGYSLVGKVVRVGPGACIRSRVALVSLWCPCGVSVASLWRLCGLARRSWCLVCSPCPPAQQTVACAPHGRSCPALCNRVTGGRGRVGMRSAASLMVLSVGCSRVVCFRGGRETLDAPARLCLCAARVAHAGGR